MSVSAYRRYCLLKGIAARRRGDWALERVWRAKQMRNAGTALPEDFPARVALGRAGYTALEDIHGANASELVDVAGLQRRDAALVIAELENSMAYSMANGRWADTDAVSLFLSEARAASVASNAVELGDCGTVRLTLDVTEVAAAGSLTVGIETREHGVAPWRPAGAFASVNAIGEQRRSFAGMDRFIRAVATIEGGPFKFRLAGEAV